MKQSQTGKLPEANERNEEIALDFAGPFQNAKKGKKYLSVSIDQFLGWPETKFLHRPTTKKVIEFLKRNMHSMESSEKYERIQVQCLYAEHLPSFVHNSE